MCRGWRKLAEAKRREESILTRGETQAQEWVPEACSRADVNVLKKAYGRCSGHKAGSELSKC